MSWGEFVGLVNQSWWQKWKLYLNTMLRSSSKSFASYDIAQTRLERELNEAIGSSSIWFTSLNSTSVSYQSFDSSIDDSTYNRPKLQSFPKKSFRWDKPKRNGITSFETEWRQFARRKGWEFMMLIERSEKELIFQHSKRGKRKISIFQFNSLLASPSPPSEERTEMKLNDEAHFEFRFDWHDDKSLHVARS